LPASTFAQNADWAGHLYQGDIVRYAKPAANSSSR
jgi:hypothetical protein